MFEHMVCFLKFQDSVSCISIEYWKNISLPKILLQITISNIEFDEQMLWSSKETFGYSYAAAEAFDTNATHTFLRHMIYSNQRRCRSLEAAKKTRQVVKEKLSKV